jgi:glyoxylase I family protein
MIRITRIDHVSVTVRDTQRALGFYNGLLGLAVSNDRPELGFPGAWLEIGDGRQIHLLELSSASDEGGTSGHGGRGRHFALIVTDLDAVTSALDKAGIDYTLSRSGRRALFCRDPDGNVIELVENA